MCGRFAFYSPSEATAALFGVDSGATFEPRYNIAPTQFIATIRRDAEQKNEMVAMRWGLVPSWAKDPSIGNRMINARAETVAEKPSFRTAYRKRRCLIPADGFYEWHTENKVKVPYFISLASGDPFVFAGLWEHWKSKDSDEILQTTTIVTAAATRFLSQVHHRMPVVLGAENFTRWLDGDMELLDEVIARPPDFQAWPVDRRVNNARNEGPELIAAAGDSLPR